MLNFVNDRIAAVLLRPDMWGPPMCVEMQILLLIEMRHVCSCPTALDETVPRWRKFICEKTKGNSSLAGNLGLTNKRSTTEFVEYIQEFVNREALLDAGCPETTL